MSQSIITLQEQQGSCWVDDLVNIRLDLAAWLDLTVELLVPLAGHEE
jgi:hypothetical protein